MSVPFVDAHCHVGTDPLDTAGRDMSSGSTERVLMSNNAYDWKRLEGMRVDAGSLPQHRGFGVHPWYSHLFTFNGQAVSKEEHYKDVLQFPESENDTVSDLIANVLPDPLCIEEFIAAVDFSLVSVIGEVGLDRSFTLPASGFYQGRDTEGRVQRTRIKVKLQHQQRMFERMCQLAVERRCSVSIHDVNAHMLVFESCKRILQHCPDVNLCLHSYTGSTEFLLTQWMKCFGPARLFLSVSRYINFKDDKKGSLDYSRIPRGSILTETDYMVDKADPHTLDEILQFLIEQLTPLLSLTSTAETKQLVYANFQRFISRAT